MNFKFTDLMKVKKNTKLEDRIKLFRYFIVPELIGNDDYARIANLILDDSIDAKKKLNNRKITPAEYYGLVLRRALSAAEDVVTRRDYDFKEKAAGEESEDRRMISHMQIHAKEISYYFAELYKEYYVDMGIRDLFKMMPKNLKLYNGANRYIALYWEYITPPYDLVLCDARRMVLDIVGKDLAGSPEDEINWQKKVVNEQLNSIDTFYNKYIDLEKFK